MSGTPAPHPRHDAVAAAIREAYRQSHPAMGYRVERRSLGWFQYAPGPDLAGAVTVDEIDPASIRDLAPEIRRAYGDSAQVALHVEGRTLDARLRDALVAAGFEPIDGTTYLAHVGDASPVPLPHDVGIEDAGDATLAEWVRVKQQGFANGDADPPPDDLERELALRRAERAGAGRFRLASVGGQPAAAIGFYDGRDRLVFDLATPPRFRRRGLARVLLARVIAETKDAGHRSVVINTDENGWPAAWYRRLGFTDEVYWRRRYRVPVP